MIQLALKMLFGDRVRYLTLMIGIFFVSFLFIQLGSVFCGIMARIIKPIEAIGAPIWVADAKLQSIDDSKPLLDTDLNRIRSIPGVKWAVPLFLRTVQVRLRDGRFQVVRLFGLDDASLVGRPAHLLAGDISMLSAPEAVIIGRAEAERLGNPKVGDTFEINDHLARVVGIADVPRDFGSNPYVYTTYSRALEYTPRQRKQMNFILVAPNDSKDTQALTKRIQELSRLAAYTEDEMRWLSMSYYIRNTAIPINFGIGVLMAFVVGMSIVGQTFYSFALQNERYFAALKAMGAGPGTMVTMMIVQALSVALISFGIGAGMACLFGFLTGAGTGKLAFFTPYQLVAGSFLIVILICLSASLFSIHRVVRLEPAVVFHS
ncbi:MAG: ABC transporter permease [Acidobacteriota bacterium]